MKKPHLSWLLCCQILLLCSTITNTVLVDGQCLNDQRSHLLDLKNSISFDLELSTRLVQWNPEEDCCGWRGVGCDASGRVITLELDQESISGGVENLTSLFRLQFLEKLNLGSNYFNDIPIPKAIANLTNLVYLNISNSGFAGQVPIELSKLRKLVSLDLSTSSQGMKLENPTLKMLLQNLSNIEEIYLDGMDLSGQGSGWFQDIAASLTKLRVLSLRNCYILGGMNISSSIIPNLSVIRLDNNNISAEVPEFFANMPNLRILSFSSCNLVGQFPVKIFQVQALQTLDISDNNLLHGSLPPFPENSSLREIVLHDTSFSGSLPNSIANLHKLEELRLSFCNFSGTIPAALGNLLELSYLDLSENNFSGPIPEFKAAKNLVYIDLSFNTLTGKVPEFQASKNLVEINLFGNSLTGSLSSAHFKGLQSLQALMLGNNSLSGSLPTSLFELPALRGIQLSYNQFSGQIDEIPDRLSISGTQLLYLDLSSNQFNGSFPKFLFELKQIGILSLSSNSFTDTIQLETFKNLPNLTLLDLSYSNLTVELQNYNSSIAKLSEVRLASCKLQSIPEMKGQAELEHLDLSNNEITGEIPNWIWNMQGLRHVNLSMNSFVGLQKPYEISVSILDLHSNLLQGEVPSLRLSYADYSRNKFSGPIPSVTELDLYNIQVLSISNNSLTGSIPESLCNASNLLSLDLSNNTLNGTIPSCLMTRASSNLRVLNLAGNNISGSIPDTFPKNCSLKSLELYRNQLQGKLPRTLSNCIPLEVINLGHNNIEDVFPCMFENSSNLHVLILRSNKFQGKLECFGYNYSWPRLQIIDIASNNFSGVLSTEFFSSLKIMVDSTQGQRIADNLRFDSSFVDDFYYQFKARVTLKGLEIELEKILTIFTVIDFSSNKFSGNIPESIGDLKALYVLDLSENEITGGIPSSIGKLRTLGSLDLSMNQLTGEIPLALTDLNFLSFLNLSFNTLTGKIPTGPQFHTFTMDSYIGNAGLCGFPLNVSCGNANDSGSSSFPTLSNTNEVDWMYISVSVGYTVGLGIFLMLLFFCERWRLKLFDQVDRFLLKVGLGIGRKRTEPIRRL